jgi:hypothetical protein
LDKDVDPASLTPLPLGGAKIAENFQREVESLGKQIPGVANQTRQTCMTLMPYGDDQNQKLLKLWGRNNAMGRAAVYAVDADLGTAIVIYLLPLWTDDKGVFRVGLSDLDKAPKFSQAGRLRVWLLDQEKEVASETLTWPGKLTSTPTSTPVTIPSGQPSTPQPGLVPPAAPGALRVANPVVGDPGQPPAEKPAPVGPKAPVERGKPVVEKPLPMTGPALPAHAGGAASTPVGPAVVPPTRPGTESGPLVPQQPSAPLSMKEMNVDQLVDHIDKTWGGDMSLTVHRWWKGALRQYYGSQNPISVRRDVLMITIRSCYEGASQAGLRNALAILYNKLKAESRKERQAQTESR